MATGYDLRERPWQPGLDDARFNQKPRNPNVAGGISPEGDAYRRANDLRGMATSERPWSNADTKAFGTRPAGVEPPIGERLRGAAGAVRGRMAETGNALRDGYARVVGDTARSGPQPQVPAGQGAGTSLPGRAGNAAAGGAKSLAHGAGVLGAGGYGLYNTYQGAKEGDWAKAGLGALDTAAAVGLVTPAAPVAGAYLGLRGVYDGAKALVDATGDAVGGTINQIGLNTGLWGVDDSAYLRQQAEQFGRSVVNTAPDQKNAQPQPSPQTQDNNPHAAANQAKLDAFAAEERARVAAGQAPTYDPNQARPDLGYGAIGDRRALTNEQAAAMNPAGRITATRGPGGTMEFSGGDVSGQVSYQDPSGQALPGGGLRGRGFSNFDVAPAGANVVMGPGGYAFATSGSGLRGGSAATQSDFTHDGIDVRGMSGAQAAQYADEVRRAQNFNQAWANARGAQGGAGDWNDLRNPERLAYRNAMVSASGMKPYGKSKQEWAAQQAIRLKEADSIRDRAVGREARNQAEGVERHKSDNTLRGQEMSADATRYSADATRYSADQRLRGDIYQAEGQRAQATAAAARQREKDEFERGFKVNAEQRAAREDTYKRHRVPSADGKGVDEVGTQGVVNTLEQVVPGYSTMPPAEQAKYGKHADALGDLYLRMRDQKTLSPLADLFSSKPQLTGMRDDLKGGKRAQQGLLYGWGWGQSGVGGTYLVKPDGQEINLGTGLNDLQLRMIDNALKTGKFLSEDILK